MKSPNIIDILIGVLIYISMLFFGSNAILLLVLLILAAKEKNILIHHEMILLFLFVLFAILNILFHLDKFDLSRHFSSFAVPLVLFMAIFAPRIKEVSLKTFVILTCFEILVGLYEFEAGRVALFYAQIKDPTQELFVESNLLYDLRVYGLSSNSSAFAEKIFLCILIVAAVPNILKNKLFWITYFILGLLISFNRTAIISSLFFLIYLFITKYKEVIFKNLRVFIPALLIIGFCLMIYLDDILYQLFRGKVNEFSGSEFSRFYFWKFSLDQLSLNPLQGNGSLTFRIVDPSTASLQHAHNSFLMLFSTHGLLISFFLLAYIFKRLKFANLHVISSMILFSMTQYFIFWNLSVPDLVFYWFLNQRNFYSGGINDLMKREQ